MFVCHWVLLSLVWLACREEARAFARLSDDIARHRPRACQSHELFVVAALRTQSISRGRGPACVSSGQRGWDGSCCRCHGGCHCQWLNKLRLFYFFSPCVFRCWQVLERLPLRCLLRSSFALFVRFEMQSSVFLKLLQCMQVAVHCSSFMSVLSTTFLCSSVCFVI